MRAAVNDLAQRFGQIGATDAQSQRDAGAQLRALRAARDALYRSIIAQIRTEASVVARQRGLRSVEFVSAVPTTKGFDLTPAVAARLAR
jgi:hypothetical protein